MSGLDSQAKQGGKQIEFSDYDTAQDALFLLAQHGFRAEIAQGETKRSH
jgi:hypothetical protein